MRNLYDYVGKTFMAEHIKDKEQVLELRKLSFGFALASNRGYYFYVVEDGGSWDVRDEDKWICLEENDFWDI